MVSKYFQLVVILLALVAVYGLVAPALISYPDDTAVLLGVLLALLSPVGFSFLLKGLFKRKDTAQ